MKKFLSILFCSIIIFSTLCVGVSAATHSAKGGFYLNDSLTYLVDGIVNDVYFFDEDDRNYGYIYYGQNFEGGRSLYFGEYIEETDEFIDIEVYDFTSSSYVSESLRTITILEDYSEGAFSSWLAENSTELYCDGTSCPSGETDNDGYCIDCYRSVNFNLTPDVDSSVYPSNLPPIPDSVNNASYEHFIFETKDGDIKLYTYKPLADFSDDTLWVVYGNSNTDELIMDALASYAYGRAHELLDGVWVDKGSLSGDYIPCKRPDLIYSSVIIYDENGDIFFPQTLWVQVLKATQGAMKMEIPTMSSSVGFLVLCGIGCLALLIGLVLLPKILKIFLR